MKNNNALKALLTILLPFVTLSCSKNQKTFTPKTHVEIVNEALESPLCEVTELLLEGRNVCKVRLQHKFLKISENSYEVHISSIDDCIDLSLNNLTDTKNIVLAEKQDLNQNLFNDESIYYIDFSLNKLSADIINSSKSEKIDVLRNYSPLSFRFIPAGSESSDTTILSKNLCSSTNPEIHNFCSSYYLGYVGKNVSSMQESKRKNAKLKIYSLLFKENFCEINTRSTLYNTFLLEAGYISVE